MKIEGSRKRAVRRGFKERVRQLEVSKIDLVVSVRLRRVKKLGIKRWDHDREKREEHPYIHILLLSRLYIYFLSPSFCSAAFLTNSLCSPPRNIDADYG